METLRPSTLRRSDGAAGDGSVAAELRDVALASLSGAAKGSFVRMRACQRVRSYAEQARERVREIGRASCRERV